MSFPSGTRLGPYTIGTPLGAGGMGTVYEATDTRLRRLVAIKVLNPAEHDPERERDLEREGRAVAKLSHPNICVIHDVGRQDGQFYLVMERLVGETLEQRLQRGALAVSEALQYAVDIAGALDAAHRARILHRDLKPSNVMLTKTGPKLLDFGIATSVAPHDNLGAVDGTATSLSHVAPSGVFAGTPRYMSPERLEGKPADVRSDLFALGALLYEMLAARPAFAGSSTAALTASILTGEPAALEGVPPGMDRIIRRCLAKNPEERWQTARDLREAFGLLRLDATGPAVPPPASVRRWLPITAIVSLAIAVGVAAWLGPWWAAWPLSSGTPVIVLMDSPVPERVYDDQTRKDGGTNADDITDILRDLPVELHKETTSALWHREDEVLKQHPRLIMMHLSSFAEPTTDPASPLQPNAQERTRSFLGYVALAEERTQFVVYSRGFPTEQDRAEWVRETEQRFPTLRGRVQMMHVPGEDKATFRSPEARHTVRQLVTALLNLQ